MATELTIMLGLLFLLAGVPTAGLAIAWWVRGGPGATGERPDPPKRTTPERSIPGKRD